MPTDDDETIRNWQGEAWRLFQEIPPVDLSAFGVCFPVAPYYSIELRSGDGWPFRFNLFPRWSRLIREGQYVRQCGWWVVDTWRDERGVGCSWWTAARRVWRQRQWMP